MKHPPELLIAVHNIDKHTPEFWMIRDAATGRELGSYVPFTKSVRCGPNWHCNVPDSTAAMALFVAYAATISPISHARARSSEFFCNV